MPDIPAATLNTLQDTAVVPSTTYYLGLNTADPGTTGASEDTTLTRQSITFGTSTSGTQASTSSQTFSSVAGSNTYTGFSVWTAASSGTYVRGGTLTTSITPASGADVTVATGAITFTAS